MPRRYCRYVEPNKALKPGVGLVANYLHWSAGTILQEVFVHSQFVGLKQRDKGSSSMKFRLKQSDQVCGFLDKGTSMTGELESTGTLRIDGNFQGSISTADNVIVGKDAVVHADIKVAEIQIHGQFFGNIEAKNRVEIFPTGRVRGDIHTPVLRISEGALLDGVIRMADERPDGPFPSTGTVAEQSNNRPEGN
jgi:cytoskeletal protein CcmA (bactofilin family)